MLVLVLLMLVPKRLACDAVSSDSGGVAAAAAVAVVAAAVAVATADVLMIKGERGN